MRKPIIAGNWKMNTTIDEAMDLVEDMIEDLEEIDGVDIVICPPFLALATLADADYLEDTTLHLGAQNMHWQEKGAYTGEISPVMLAELVEFVIIGHSERRQYFGETDESVNLKVKSAIKHDLTPILCIGEALTQREKNETNKVITTQLTNALKDVTLDEIEGLVIAYEPIWAIGTGRAATPVMANETIAFIRQTIAKLYNEDTASAIRIQYGGSVTSDNIVELMQQPDIDGALVGGASLKVDEFIAIVAAAAEIRGGAVLNDDEE